MRRYIVLVLIGCGTPTPNSASDGGSDSASTDVTSFDVAPADTALGDAGIDAAVDAQPDAPLGMAVLMPGVTMIDMGAADIGESKLYDLVVNNTGTAGAQVMATVTGAGRVITVPWGGCFAPAGQSCSINIRFLAYAAGEYSGTLTLTSGTWSTQLPVRGETYTSLFLYPWGGGSIEAAAQGISCSGACETRYTDSVVLTAVPAQGKTFVAWSDPTCGAQPTCTLPRDAAGRGVRASFAATSPVQLNITITGSGRGVVRIVDTSSSNYEIASCSTSCTVPVPAATSLQVLAQSLSQVVSFTGACSGVDRCDMTLSSSASLTVTMQASPKERLARRLETAPIVSASYDSAGNLVILTRAWYGKDKKVIKLDPQGNTLWAHPGFEGTEIRIGPSDTIYVRLGRGVWALEPDGYQGGFAYDFASIDPFNYSQDPHFTRRLVTRGSVMAAVGTNAGTTLQMGAPNQWVRTLSASSLQQIDASASRIFVATANAFGGADIVSVDYSGNSPATVGSAAAHSLVAFDVLSAGDIVTVSSTANEVSLRRLSSGTTVFTRTVTTQLAGAPHVAVAETSGDRLFMLYGARAPNTSSPAGYNAEIVTATGSVEWSVSRPPTNAAFGFGGVEVYDLAGNGLDVALVGSFQWLSTNSNAAVPTDTVSGSGFVQIYRP